MLEQKPNLVDEPAIGGRFVVVVESHALEGLLMGGDLGHQVLEKLGRHVLRLAGVDGHRAE